MPSWPASLPQALLVDGFGRQRQDAATRFQPDAGAPITRRRGTGAPTAIGGAILVTGTQLGVLDTFFNDTLKEGTLSFTWTDPVDSSSVTMAFQGPYGVTAALGTLWRVSMQLLILP